MEMRCVIRGEKGKLNEFFILMKAHLFSKNPPHFIHPYIYYISMFLFACIFIIMLRWGGEITCVRESRKRIKFSTKIKKKIENLAKREY
jgi:hypothetical protein